METGTPKKLALVVDDDPDVVTAIKMAIENTLPEYEVDTAADGTEAAEKWQERKHSLIILDLMLPKRSGFMVIDKIKVLAKGNDRPVIIMITGNLGPRHKMYAETLGVDDYIQKPFRMDRLITSITKTVTAREKQVS